MNNEDKNRTKLDVSVKYKKLYLYNMLPVISLLAFL